MVILQFFFLRNSLSTFYNIWPAIMPWSCAVRRSCTAAMCAHSNANRTWSWRTTWMKSIEWFGTKMPLPALLTTAAQRRTTTQQLLLLLHVKLKYWFDPPSFINIVLFFFLIDQIGYWICKFALFPRVSLTFGFDHY